jgi:pimeloyl-ACP methyl ester carboxylesterase
VRHTRVLAAATIVILLTLAGLGLWLYTPDQPRAALEAEYAHPPSAFIPVAGLRLHIRDTGPADAPALIMLHGFGSSLHTWEPWAQALSGPFRVIRIDLPGFGLTGADPSGDYSDERTVAVILALMDSRRLVRATLIGNSMGGRFAWRFAAAHPDRMDRLVLISPDGFASPGLEYDRTPKVPALMRALPYTLPGFMLRQSLAPSYADPARLSEPTIARYRAMMLAPGVRRAILDRMAQTKLTDPAPLLRAIRTPTLLLWGEQDAMIPIANAADYLANLPDARLVRLPGMGHVPMEEAPDATLPPLRAFLSP